MRAEHFTFEELAHFLATPGVYNSVISREEVIRGILSPQWVIDLEDQITMEVKDAAYQEGYDSGYSDATYEVKVELKDRYQDNLGKILQLKKPLDEAIDIIMSIEADDV